MYVERFLSTTIQKVSQQFRVVLLTGPRQVGKTTLLQHLAAGNRSYASFDDLNLRTIAERDPAAFIERIKLPILIDEIQYAPKVLSYIKMKVDSLQQPGLFWLTGSQQFEMMRHVSESLAGRVAVLKLQGISLAEEQGRKKQAPFLPTHELMDNRCKDADSMSIMQLYHRIWQGSYPDVVLQHGDNWERFYESYLTTYVKRDVCDYLRINDHALFYKFIQIAAARTGQLVNYKNMANDVGVSEPTIKSWLQVLEASGLIYLLNPYHTNINKRLIKTPKLYFMDTGLCCFLTGWLNPDVLERGAMSGAMLETFAVTEIIKSYFNCGRTPRIYFYRDRDQREIDLLIEENGTIYPVEIKKTASINNIKVRNFDALQTLGMPIGLGSVLCFVKDILPIAKNIDAVPLSYI